MDTERDERLMKNKKEKCGASGQSYGKAGSLAWAIRRLWKLDRMFVFYIFATVPVAVALPLVQSYYTKGLIDSIGLGAGFGELARICAGFMGAIVTLHLLDEFVREKCRSREYYPTFAAQNELYRKSDYETDYENTERQEFKEMFGYAGEDACRGDCSLEWIWRDISGALTHLAGIVTYASLLAFIHPVIFFLVAAVSALSYSTARWQTVYYEKHKKEWEREARRKNYLQNLSSDFRMAKDIKLYGLEGWLDKMMRDYQAYILMWDRRCNLRGLWAAVLSGLMTLIQDGAVYGFLIALLVEKAISVGDFVFYFGVVGSMAAFLTGIISDIAKLNSRAEKVMYYRNVLDYPDHGNHGEGCTLPTGAVSIEFRDVWYRYDGAGDDTIKGLNLTIAPGESIALVGRNGAGKTTLAKLISGLYAPTKGQILVNGREIAQYNIEEYYSMISAVFQEVKAVAFTIRAFVSSAAPDRANAGEEAAAALKAAGLWEKIESLPHGMETHLMKGIYDDGVDLSGGEMQKLLLARAIYKDGSILILDEPTAALDPIAENRLYLQYRDLTKDKTSVYISHRFASTRFCDRIILLQDGRIAESGSHEELMELGGQYAYMFGVQSRYYDSARPEDAGQES